MWTGIPVFKLTEAESQKLIRMEEELHKRVVGQEEAIVAVSKSIRRARAGIKDPKRPTGSFIFLGPSAWGRPSSRARSPSSSSATRTRDPGRHVGVHGEALRVAPRRLAAGLHRLRRGRPAHRGRAPEAVLRGPHGRDREGPSGRVQHPAPDPGGGKADRRPGAPRRLPEHDRDHDVEHRRRLDREEPGLRLLHRRRAGSRTTR